MVVVFTENYGKSAVLGVFSNYILYVAHILSDKALIQVRYGDLRTTVF